jgi:glucose/arabinose dehydrogenase
MRIPLLLATLAASVPLAAQQIALQPIATGLSSPVGVVSSGDSRLFIVQQTGRIVIHDGTRVLPAPFLDVSSLISFGSERGLLGLAFDPHYATNGFFFIDYTDTSGNITVARYKVSATNPDVADSASRTPVLAINHTQFENHNGGQLQFGPDGYLYVGTGDGGGAGDTLRTAPDLTKLLGKILRIDVSTLPYRIPPSNPFGTEIWAYGLRNPWRFTFDRVTGDLLIADVGQDLWEEVDFQPRTSTGGENYAWHCFEATHAFQPSGPECQNKTFTMPVLEYAHTNGACSITGGYRYHGARYPRLHDIYFYGDYCSGTIWGATERSDGTWTSQVMLQTSMNISSFGEDANGELYIVDLRGAVDQIGDAIGPQERHRAARH